MSLFAIADLHLSLGTNKPMDVFKGWSNYVQRLENNWRKNISDSDSVVIAGDISWAIKLDEIEADFNFLHSLPGKKILIKGNHDYWWSTQNKMSDFFLQHGYDSLNIVHNSCCQYSQEYAVCGSRGWMYNSETVADIKVLNREVGRLRTSIESALNLNLKPLVFLHYPPIYDTCVCQEIVDLLRSYEIKDCYYGHIHGAQASKRAVVGEYDGISLHLISGDYLKFTPLKVI